MSNRRLSNVSHVIVDEVHERSVETDLMLLLLLQNLKDMNCHKVVLMSATANTPDFVNYFSSEVLNDSLAESECSVLFKLSRIIVAMKYCFSSEYLGQ